MSQRSARRPGDRRRCDRRESVVEVWLKPGMVRDLVPGEQLARVEQRGRVWHADHDDVWTIRVESSQGSHHESRVIRLNNLLGNGKVQTDEDVNVVLAGRHLVDLRGWGFHAHRITRPVDRVNYF